MIVKNNDIKKSKMITGVQIFLSSRCNLSCAYCYISKEKSLFEYDNIIRENLENGTYAKAIIDLNNTVGGEISHVELWGGEPTFNLDSFGKHLDSIIVGLPKLNRIVMSSNMTGNIDKLITFLSLLDARESDRPFTFNLQVSMDGPSWINDHTRGGKDSSRMIIENVKTLISRIKLYKTKLDIVFKSTLPIDSIKSLCSFEKVLEYFKFWDDTIIELRKAIGGKAVIELYNNVVPTIVYPGMYSKEDGIILSQFLRTLGKLAHWNSKTDELKNYKKLDMFNVRYNRDGHLDLPTELPFCGVYTDHVALLYTGDVIACHRSFFDLIDSYVYSERKDVNKREVMADSSERRMSIRSRVLNIYDSNFNNKLEKTKSQYITSESRVAAIAMLIRAMANVGQVSSLYKDENKALEAALVVRNQNDCTYDNQITTGTVSLMEIGMIRILCNGAVECILEKGIGGVDVGYRV